MRAHLLAGLLVAVPLGVTIWILIWAFESIDGILQPVLEPIFGRKIPGVGFGITLALVYILGVIASNVFGRRLIAFAERIVSKVPIARPLYNGIRQILQSFADPGDTGYMHVVLVEFPRKGIRTIGFVTNETRDTSGQRLLNIFIPTSPNPTSGFLQIVHEEDVIWTDLSIDTALKMVVSGGRLSPDEIHEKVFSHQQEVRRRTASRRHARAATRGDPASS